MEAPQKRTAASEHPFAGNATHINPERANAGAYGTFTVINDIPMYTRAKLFNGIGKPTRVFARFSTADGDTGSANTERAPLGFTVTFYTEDGSWELVGSNMPVCVARNPNKSEDFPNAPKQDPDANDNLATMRWDYRSHHPESLHQIMMLLSDRGTPYGYRHLNGYGSQTFSFINTDDERFWVKFQLKTAQGIRNLTAGEGADRKANDPDFAQRDLSEAISRGEFPRWHLTVQVMPEADAKTYRHNPFDLTKTWPQADYPLIEVGVMELNEHPDGSLAHAGQSAVAPTHVVDGIGFPPENAVNAADVPETDPYSQPGDLYRRVMTVEQRRLLIVNIIRSMSGIDGPHRDKIINLQLCHWFRADLTLGMAVAQGLGLNMQSLSSMMMQHT